MGFARVRLLARSVHAWQFAFLLIGLAASLVPVLPKTHSFWGCHTGWNSLTPNQVRVWDVLPNSPASAAGLKDGDWILSIDGWHFDSAEMWKQMEAHLQPGQKVQLRVKRNKKELTLTAVGFEPQLEAIVYNEWQIAFGIGCIVFLILLVATKPLRPLASLWRPILLVLVVLAVAAVLLNPDWRREGHMLLDRRWFVDNFPFPWVQLSLCVAVAVGLAVLGAWEIRGILLALRGKPGMPDEHPSNAPSRADRKPPVGILAATDSTGNLPGKQRLWESAAPTTSVASEAVSAKNFEPTGAWTPDPELESKWSALPVSFGRYELQKLLGRGAMGMVFLAHDRQLDRLVALKIPQFSEPQREAFRERFLREARAAAKLSHPNLCPLYDVGDVDGFPYLTMPVIEGESLSEILRRGQIPEIRQAAQWVHDIALAVQELHRLGIIHRDLKPSNIMVNQRGEPVVMDFGLAYRAPGATDPRLTQSGNLLGTPAYMAPEQAMGETQAVAPSSDVYSLGVVLFEMLTGRVPFQAPTLGKLLAQIERDPPPAPSFLRPNLDPVLERICLRVLAKQPGDRFASMADFAAALAPFATGNPSPMEVSDTTARLPQPRRRSAHRSWFPIRTWMRRLASFCTLRRRIVLGVAVVLLGLGCLFILALAADYWRPASAGENPFVTRETYLQIKANMTEMEVNDLLGGEGIIVEGKGLIVDEAGNFTSWEQHVGSRHENGGRFENHDGKALEQSKKEVQWLSGNKSIFVTFNDGRVVGKRERGLYRKPP